MRRAWPILLMLLLLTGCGPGRYEELAREQTELNEELAREFEAFRAALPTYFRQTHVR